MGMLKNFTVRRVLLTVLGLFCLLWSAVGVFTVYRWRSWGMATPLTISWCRR